MTVSAEEKTTALIAVGISSCLLGEKVRYDGGHKQNRYIIDTLGRYFEFRSFCPEMAIGLGVPRPTIRLVRQNDRVEAVGVKDAGLAVTDALIQVSQQQKHWHSRIYGYIVKKGSPSCGMERVKVYKDDVPTSDGQGLYTQTMMQNFPSLPVEEEGRLGDPVLRENFIQRVFVYRRWHEMLESGLEWSRLMDFHARHKLILFSHDQNAARKLGKALSTAQDRPIEAFSRDYVSELMQILKIRAKRSNHVNVLEHIRGYLKHDLEKDDKTELTECIENYRQGYLPLLVPVTLLRHHFRKCPNEYIERSYYMRPHPDELMLRHSL